MHDHLAVGTRVRLTHAVDRFPHFIAPEGATGTVVTNTAHEVNVRMDEHIDGAEEWDNEVQWANDDLEPDGYLSEDLEVLA